MKIESVTNLPCFLNTHFSKLPLSMPVAENEVFPSTKNPDFGKFATLSYFKEGIGLVMESQYNHKGEIIYELSLIDYKVTMKGDEK